MNGSNWFNAAAAPGGGGGANLGASSSSLFGNSSSFNNNNNPQQPGGGLFGNSSTNNNANNNLNGSTLFGGLNTNNNNNGGIPNSPSSAAFGGQTQARNGTSFANQNQDIPATEYNENQRLQNKYLESFTPGGNKKKGAGATKTTSSPTGGPMGAFTEPSRFGSNSLYGSGAGVSPNKSSHRLSNNNTTSTNRDTSQSTSSPLGNSSMSVRSRMSTGGSASEERPGQGYSHSYGYTGYGGGAGVGGMGEDPERPPVRSYADDDGAELNQQTTQGQAQGMGGGMEDEDGMRYDDDTDGPAHMLMVYGLPPSKQDRLQSFLSSFGTLTHFQVGPIDSNYIVVAFDDPSVALRLQRQSGEVRMDGWYLGFRSVSEGAVPEAWSRSKSGGGQLEVRRNGEGNHGHAESHAMDLRSAPSITTTAVSTNNKNSDDPFASISTLTPIKSGGSVFRPTATSASNGQQQQQQQKVDPRFAFGTGQQQQQQQQQQTGQQTQGGGGYGFFGKISDVMFGH